MKETEILSALEELVPQLGMELRYEKGDFHGGMCRVGDRRLILINSRLQPSQKIQILVSELARCNLSNVYIVPAVRELIEQAQRQGEMEA